MPDNAEEKIISDVKKKPELSGLPDSVVREALAKYLRKNNLGTGDLDKLKDNDIKLVVKDLRSILRLSVGQFRSSFSAQDQLLKQNRIQELLKTHSSTAERLEFYYKLQELIRSLKVSSILDLGCGLNPLMLSNKVERYYACDINESDVQIVSDFFRKNKINGEASVCDLRKIKDGDLPSVDLCIIFKLFDVLEKRGHKLSERILCNTKAKYFLISFSTKTLSGRPMNHPQRGWIELLLKRLGFQFKVIKSKNEIFYLAWESNN